MNTLSRKMFVILIALSILAAGCQRSVTRNSDGTLTAETTISQQELQDVITKSIADPLIQELTVSLESGYVLVSGTRQRLNDASKNDTLTFRLDLGVSNGQITSSISNAQIDGVAIEQNRVDNWNQTIANRIALLGQKNRNSVLQSVSITPDAVTMTWSVSR